MTDTFPFPGTTPIPPPAAEVAIEPPPPPPAPPEPPPRGWQPRFSGSFKVVSPPTGAMPGGFAYLELHLRLGAEEAAPFLAAGQALFDAFQARVLKRVEQCPDAELWRQAADRLKTMDTRFTRLDIAISQDEGDQDLLIRTGATPEEIEQQARQAAENKASREVIRGAAESLRAVERERAAKLHISARSIAREEFQRARAEVEAQERDLCGLIQGGDAREAFNRLLTAAVFRGQLHGGVVEVAADRAMVALMGAVPPPHRIATAAPDELPAGFKRWNGTVLPETWPTFGPATGPTTKAG